MASPWLGFRFSAWRRLLGRNPGAIPASRLHVAAGITAASLVHSGLAFLENVIWSRRIDAVRLEPPLFILGHWRSGTTHLHELLVQDPAHTSPNTYECFDPNHFLLTEGSTDRLLAFLLPSRRPMDNMAVGFARPQEDEFALCGIGLPSPYLSIAFPGRPPQDPEYLDFDRVPAEQVDAWQQGLARFLKRVALKRPGRIVLKSPAHTARLPALVRAFPDARFIHIVRDPYEVFPSTLHLWKSLQEAWAIAPGPCPWLREHVLQSFVRMYAAFDRGVALVPRDHLVHTTYEDLVARPLVELQRIYSHLGLGDFDRVRPSVERYLDGLKDYKRNEFKTSREDIDAVTQHWGHIVTRYGYPLKTGV